MSAAGRERVPVVAGSLPAEVEGCGFWQSLFGGAPAASGTTAAPASPDAAAVPPAATPVASQPAPIGN